MVKVIRDIYILRNEGVVIFKRTFDEKVDAQLFGGFMSALNSFAAQISAKGMNGFEMGDVYFALRKENSLIFIANCPVKTNRKDLHKEFDIVVKRFITMFPPDFIGKWDGNMEVFAKFNDSIKDSLETPVQKFKESFW